MCVSLGLGLQCMAFLSLATPSLYQAHTVSKPPDVPELASPSNPRPSFFRAPSSTVALYVSLQNAIAWAWAREGEGGRRPLLGGGCGRSLGRGPIHSLSFVIFLAEVTSHRRIHSPQAFAFFLLTGRQTAPMSPADTQLQLVANVPCGKAGFKPLSC
jgi:hypothetical protein